MMNLYLWGFLLSLFLPLTITLSLSLFFCIYHCTLQCSYRVLAQPRWHAAQCKSITADAVPGYRIRAVSHCSPLSPMLYIYIYLILALWVSSHHIPLFSFSNSLYLYGCLSLSPPLSLFPLIRFFCPPSALSLQLCLHFLLSPCPSLTEGSFSGRYEPGEGRDSISVEKEELNKTHYLAVIKRGPYNAEEETCLSPHWIHTPGNVIMNYVTATALRIMCVYIFIYTNI